MNSDDTAGAAPGASAPAARSASSTVKDSGWSRSGPHSMADFTELPWITTRDGTGAYRI